jgi:glucosamine--fructose-6-phosphate aminotransferase (isomerizing)
VSPELFAADLEEKPARLRALAEALPDLWQWAGEAGGTAYLLGMGSSHYANQVVAARMRAAGLSAVAEIASTDLLPRIRPHDTVFAVSASGGSAETLDAVRRLREEEQVSSFVAITNTERNELRDLCDDSLSLLAGEERGGVACRSFQHTLAVLLALVPGFDIGAVARAADATEHLLTTRDEWLPEVSSLLLGPSGTHIVAPARRLSSALQSALMLREGPRLPAVGCETGDWSHVDVYLTKTTDYRMLLLGGSRWEPQLLEWTEQRGATVVAAGTAVPGATYTLRYPYDDDDDVRLLTETLVAELVAARAWSAAAG